MSETLLPPLPAPKGMARSVPLPKDAKKDGVFGPLFTAEQMREYALAAVAAASSAPLAAFGAWAAREFRDHLSDVDGGSAQEAMVRLGVLELHQAQEPCGEACVCAGYGPFPHECYRFTAAVAAAMSRPTPKDNGENHD
jgi:hypothetical protein